MRILALLSETRGERRAYAAAVAALSRRGHEVTIAVPHDARAFDDDVPGARLVRLVAAVEPLRGATNPLVRDCVDRTALSRAAGVLAKEAEAVIFDVASGLSTVQVLVKGVRKVALLLDSAEELAMIREPSIPAEDDARFLAHQALVEFAERACRSTIVPFRASAAGGRSMRPGGVRVAAPGVPAGWPGTSPARAEARSGSDAPLIAALIAPTPAHGFDVLVEAFRRIHEAIPRARLVVAGCERPAFRPRRPFRAVAIERLAGAARDAISLVNDDDATLREVLRDADLVLHPSFAPGSGSAIVEALAAGAPLIASSIDAHREWLTDGRDALLVEPGDPAALAEAALALIRDPARARALATAGRDLAARRFDLERLAGDLEEAVTEGA